MKKQILLLGLILGLSIGAFAQQLQVPMKFVVNTPASIAGTYEHGYASDWGPTTIVTTCADLAWGYTAAGDSLGCDTIVTDLTGKIAMISRGVCNFSEKAYRVQEAGAVGIIIVNYVANPADELVTMAGGTFMDLVTIPSIFVGYGTGGQIATAMDAGTVNVCFEVTPIDGARGLYNYATPKDQAQTLENFELTVFNNDEVNSETNVVAYVEITDPNGMVSILSENVGTMLPSSSVELEFTGTYTPPIQTGTTFSVVGRYEVKYFATSDQGTYDQDSILQYFDITEDMYRNDANGTVTVPVPNATSWANFRYDIGNVYYPVNAGVATHASFVLRNAGYLHGESMDVILYDAVGLWNGIDYNVAGNMNVVGLSTIVIDSTIHGINDTVVVAIEPFAGTQNDLIPDSTYMITVQYDALAGNGLPDPPSFGASVGRQDMWATTNILQLDAMYTGWANAEIILRLHMDNTNSVKNLVLLDELSAKVYPNPAKDFVTLDLNFEEVAEDVNVQIIDMQGRIIRTFNYNNIQEAKYTYDVDFLGSGNYFFRVQTEEGFTTKHFIVIK